MDGLGPNEMAISLGKYLGCGDVPWLRMYDPFPDWQQQSGLLTHELHTDVVGTPVLVFCTLTMPRNRKALGGARAWENKGAPKPKAESLHFDMTKLYYPKDGANKRKEDGFTVIEFVLKNKKSHVALCVLHRTDYRHVNRDLLACTKSSGLSHTPWQSSMIGPSYSLLMNDIPSVESTSFGYANASAENFMPSHDNTRTMNGNQCTATLLPEPDAPADEMSTQNDALFTSFCNDLDPLPPNQNVTTNHSETLLEPSPPGEPYWPTEQDYYQDGQSNWW